MYDIIYDIIITNLVQKCIVGS